jgi:hypothetical protein
MTKSELIKRANDRRKDATKEIEPLKRAVETLERDWKRVGARIAAGKKVSKESMRKSIGRTQERLHNLTFWIAAALWAASEAAELEMEEQTR